MILSLEGFIKRYWPNAKLKDHLLIDVNGYVCDGYGYFGNSHELIEECRKKNIIVSYNSLEYLRIFDYNSMKFEII